MSGFKIYGFQHSSILLKSFCFCYTLAYLTDSQKTP